MKDWGVYWKLSLMIHPATCSKSYRLPQSFNPFRVRGNFFDDKIPGCRLPNLTAATACYFTPCRLKFPPPQERAPWFAFLGGSSQLDFNITKEFILSQKKYPGPELVGLLGC